MQKNVKNAYSISLTLPV